MLILQGIHVWDTEEPIDLVIEQKDSQRFFAQDNACVDGVIDASHLTLAPGFVDPHVHLRDPGQRWKEDMESGCKAAAAGGYTSICLMPNTIPALDGEEVSADVKTDDDLANYRDAIDYLCSYERDHHPLPVRYLLATCATKGREGIEVSNSSQWGRYVKHKLQEDPHSPLEPTAQPSPSARASSSSLASPFTPAAVDSSPGDLHQGHPVVMISDDGSAVPDELIDEVLLMARQTGLPLVEHCEHHESGCMNEGEVSRELGVEGIAASTELAIVERDIRQAHILGVPLHLQHISTQLACEAVRQAKAKGYAVTAETAPHYLSLTDEDVRRLGTLAKMNPPLRTPCDRDAVIQAVVDGTIDMIATDHAPHTLEEKMVECKKDSVDSIVEPTVSEQALFKQSIAAAPNGIIGLETAYGVCYTVLVQGGYISHKQLISLMAVAPARLLGQTVTPITQLLETIPGCSRRVLRLNNTQSSQLCDLVILDEHASWKVQAESFYSRARNTPFDSWELHGQVQATILGGKLVFTRLSTQLST